jgi:hydroxyacylglutathione hydrolase
MYFKQFYLGCLAHASYLIGSDGEAVVVDPQRDVELYVAEAEALGLKIKYVIETHLHADFVSGHRELAAHTGAEIIFGERAGAAFPHLGVKEGDEIAIGKVMLRFLDTPGHTPESISVLVIDTEVSDKPEKVLTGDTLFVGDVGRPDLVGSKGYTPEVMAGMLYDSLHDKLLKLDDHVEVYPAHGAGSMCGRNISKQTSSTIGEQKRFNYALKVGSKTEFIKLMTTDLSEAPRYFSMDAQINREGAPALADLPPPAELTPAEVDRWMRQGALILDVRDGAAFASGHIPGAVNIGLGGQFASWAGSLLAPNTLIIIVAEDESGVNEAVTRLARVGIESVIGYLSGGLYAWDKAGLETASIPQLPVDELHDRIEEGQDLQIVDVRRPTEYASGHIPGAINIALSQLTARISELDQQRPAAVACASGYRSIAAVSLLARHGFRKLFNVVGGTNAWIQSGHPVSGIDRTTGNQEPGS